MAPPIHALYKPVPLIISLCIIPLDLVLTTCEGIVHALSTARVRTMMYVGWVPLTSYNYTGEGLITVILCNGLPHRVLMWTLFGARVDLSYLLLYSLT